MEIPDRKAATQEILRFIRARWVLRAPEPVRWQAGAPASARGQRPHPLDVQRQAHEVPLAAHLRQALAGCIVGISSTSLMAPVRRLREPLCVARTGRLPARLASFSPMRVRWQGAAPGRPPSPGLAFTPPARHARRCRGFPAPTDPARCSTPHRPVPPQRSAPNVSLTPVEAYPSQLTLIVDLMAPPQLATMIWCSPSTAICAL